MKKIKLIFSVLSRANYSRVKSVIKKSIESEKIEPIIVVGCSALCNEYGNIIDECAQENIVIHEKISSLMHEKTTLNMVKTTALSMLDFSNIISKYKDCFYYKNFSKAISIALKHAKPTDTVLLSPGFKSFDQFIIEKLNDAPQSLNDVLISKSLFEKLKINVGDNIRLFFQTNNYQRIPNIRNYRVYGVYETDFPDFDSSLNS